MMMIRVCVLNNKRKISNFEFFVALAGPIYCNLQLFKNELFKTDCTWSIYKKKLYGNARIQIGGLNRGVKFLRESNSIKEHYL